MPGSRPRLVASRSSTTGCCIESMAATEIEEKHHVTDLAFEHRYITLAYNFYNSLDEVPVLMNVA